MLDKNGAQKLWANASDLERRRLKLDSDPWTSREGIKLDGCPKQVEPRTFLTEVLNLRWAKYCQKMGLPYDAAPPPHLFSDLRQRPSRQLVGGSLVMLTSSVAYWHLGDRVLAPIEYFLHNGWDDKSLRVADVNTPVPGWPEKALPTKKEDDDQSPPKKRRRRARRQGAAGPKLKDLAANGMALPDLMLMMYTCVLSINSEKSIFEHAPNFNAMHNFENVSATELRADDMNAHILSSPFEMSAEVVDSDREDNNDEFDDGGASDYEGDAD